MTVTHTPADRHRVTLTFLDPDLEERYTGELAPGIYRQIRTGSYQSAFLWALGGFLYTRFSNVNHMIIIGIVGAMLVAIVAALLLMRRFHEYRHLQFSVLGFTSMAMVGALALATVSDRFIEYGALATMLVAVFSFVVLQLRFILTTVSAGFALILFCSFSLALDNPVPVTIVQTFLVAAALIPASLGVRNLEEASRDRFVQRLEISTLRDELERLLRTYLSPRVAEVVMTDPTTTDLGGRVEEVTVLFADLQGFTPMSHLMEPDQVAEVLNHYFEVVVPTVLDEGGSVLSFGGDAVVAVFNAPARCDDHPLRAARTAMKIQDAITRLRQTEGFEEAPEFRIGVNTGRVLVGNVGTDELRQFTVIGDAVNLAARLQNHAWPGAVVLGPATYDAISDLVETIPLNPVTMKGLPEPIRSYRLLGLKNGGQQGAEAASAQEQFGSVL